MIIIVESGATKSDWRKIDKDGTIVSQSLHRGTNVSSMKMETIKSILAEGLESMQASCEDRVQHLLLRREAGKPDRILRRVHPGCRMGIREHRPYYSKT